MADKLEFSIALRHLPRAARVLEVGAGQAAFAKHVGLEFYTGLEFTDKAIQRARAAGITLLAESIEEHARGGRRYDAVVAFQVLEHISDPRNFLLACLECLTPGGSLIIAVPSREGFAARTTNNILDMPPHHVTRWPERTLRRIGEILHLDCTAIEYEPVSEHHVAWARRAIIEERLRSVLGIKRRNLDVSHNARVVRGISTLASYFLRPQLSKVRGHTVVACYRKP